MDQTYLETDTSPAWWRDIRMGALLITALIMGSFFGVFLGHIFLTAGLAFGVMLAGILFFRSPITLLALLVVVRMSLDYSSQFLSLEIFHHSLSLSQLLGFGVALIGGLFTLLHWPKLFSFPLTLPYGLLMLWGTITFFYSIGPGITGREVIRVFDLFTVGFIAYVSVERYRHYRYLLNAIFLSSLIPLCFGLGQFLLGIGLTDENVSAPRIFGTFSHPNVFSLYLFTIAALAVIYFLIYARADRTRLLTFLYLVLVLTTLFFTFARVAWVTLFLFILFLVFWRSRFLIAPLLFLPIILYTFVPSIQERFSDAFHPGPDSSTVWRQTLWHDMILYTQLAHRTNFGSGMDTFPIMSEHLRGTRFGANEAHNDFVKFFVEGGFVGLTVLILFLFLTLYPILKVRRLSPSHSLKNMATLLALLFFTLIIASLTDNVFKNTPVQWLLAIVLGGLFSLYQYSLPEEFRRTL